MGIKGALRGISLEERFLHYVDERSASECWPWKASVGSHGYGQLAYDGSKVTAHTYAWSRRFGEIPAGMCVCHHCDNRWCCNPLHMFIGTRADNLKDMRDKDRGAFGEKHGRRVLTENKVRKILLMDGTNAEISRRFNVSPALVSLIKRRKLWKHLEIQT